MKTKKKGGLSDYKLNYEELESVRPSKSSHSRSTRLASITKLFSVGTNGKGVK